MVLSKPLRATVGKASDGADQARRESRDQRDAASLRAGASAVAALPRRAGQGAPLPHSQQHGRRVDALAGDVPSPRNPPVGCHFHTRCPYAREACREEPPAYDVGRNHEAACYRLDETHAYWESDPIDTGATDEFGSDLRATDGGWDDE